MPEQWNEACKPQIPERKGTREWNANKLNPQLLLQHIQSQNANKLTLNTMHAITKSCNRPMPK